MPSLKGLAAPLLFASTDAFCKLVAADLEGLEGPQHVQGVGDLPVLGALSLCSLGCTLGLLPSLPFLAAPAQGVPKVLVLICTRWITSSAVGLGQCETLSDAETCHAL